jgi:hypothetical protein
MSLRLLSKIFIAIFAIACIIKFIGDIYTLTLKKYIVKESEIFKIDSFKLQGKAFYESGGKYLSPKYVFESTNGYSFNIKKAIFKGIAYKKELADTLQYHELSFLVYSDKKTQELYFASKEPIGISVLQFQIGNKKYINIEKANREAKNKLLRNISLDIFFLCVGLILYLREGKPSDRDNIIMFILFVVLSFLCFKVF